MQILALVLLLVATVVGLAVLAVGAAWVRRSARERARRAARGQKSRSARAPSGTGSAVRTASSNEPSAPTDARPAPPAARPAAASMVAPADPAVPRKSFVDLPLLDDEPTQPMMHIDMAPASGWPNTMPASLATMAHQYAETQPAEMQKP